MGRGNCPMGRTQAAWGDPVPLFELVLPPRAAKAAVPILATASLVGLAVLGLRAGIPTRRERKYGLRSLP